jgi:peptidyl-tRNA hydrolase, PTH1 family
MKMVIGLGNPGPKYQQTRHNVGFETLFELARRFQGGQSKNQFDAETVEIRIGNEKILLLAPQTYMNLSGRSVRKAIDFYKLPLTDIIIVVDDMNLPPGKLRVRGTGSSGGQKGLQNTIEHLGTSDFSRLRIGIGRPPGKMDAADYVVGKFRKDEIENIKMAIMESADGIEVWAREGLEMAMNKVNLPNSAE